jgi:hypothetical protein
MRINNTSVCWNEVTWESTIPQYAGMRSPENQQYLSMLEWGTMRINNISVCWVLFIFIWPYSTIIKCYWFSCDPITAYWGIFDSHGTSFHHINMLLILTVPHSSILMCYSFSCDLIPAYWCIINSLVTLFQHTDILLILMVPHSSILMYCWFSGDLIPAYWHYYAGIRSHQNR